MTQRAHGGNGGVLQIDNPLSPLLWAQANHDIRQPMQALFMIARGLSRPMDQSKHEETVRYMEMALRGLQAKLDILTELSRIELGLKVPQLRPCSLSEIHARLMPVMIPLAADLGLTLRSRAPKAMVLSDASLLTNTIQGLFLNVFKLADPGDVLVACRSRTDHCSLEFYFRGPPIAEAQQSTAFVQLTSPINPIATPELGLGLGFISHLCRALGHNLECTALSKGGNRLALLLPVAT